MAMAMTREQKQMACRLDAKGLSHEEIARDLSYSLSSIKVALLGHYRRNAPADEWAPAPGRLSADDREEILVGLSRGESMSAMARGLGRAPSTVTREVAANGGPRHYGAWKGRCRARAVGHQYVDRVIGARPGTTLLGRDLRIGSWTDDS